MHRAACTLALVVLWAGSSLAAPPGKAPASGDPRYQAGLAAEKEQDFERALKLFEEIPPGERTVFTRLHIATCKVRLGRFVEAEEDLTALVKDPAAAAVRETAQSDLDDLRARMPKLTVRMAAGSAADVWVTVDGKPVGPPVTIPLNPGTHRVTATRAGSEVFRQNVTLQDSQLLEVEIDTSLTPPAPPVANVSVPASPNPPPAAAPTNDRSTSTESSGLRRFALPAFATGAVFVGGSIASFLLASGAQRDVEAGCRAQAGPQCDLELAGRGRVRSWETLGWASGGLALASVAFGVVALTVSDRTGERSVTLAPVVGETPGLVLRGRF